MQSSLKNVSGHAAIHRWTRAAFRSGQVSEVFGRSLRQGEVDAWGGAVIGMEGNCCGRFNRDARDGRRGCQCGHAAAAGAGAALAAGFVMLRGMIGAGVGANLVDTIGSSVIQAFARHGAVLRGHRHVGLRWRARQHARRGNSLERDGGKQKPDEEHVEQFVHPAILASPHGFGSMPRRRRHTHAEATLDLIRKPSCRTHACVISYLYYVMQNELVLSDMYLRACTWWRAS